MKKLVFALFAVILSFGFGAPDAEAKRLGGGGSFGMQRQMTPQQAPRPPAAAPQQAPQGANTVPQKRSWLGPIAGLAAGLGLAALFSHLGLGEELASFVMIALLVFAAVVLFRLLARRATAGPGANRMQYAAAGAHAAPSADRIAAPNGPAGEAPALPRDFDAAGFARQAKAQFIRLQAANDTGNVDDLREFTTPEVFAELKLQLSERGAGTQRTDVVELNADVLEVAEEPTRYIVSVRFSGLLREDVDAAPAPFDEVWHLTKPRDGNGGWVVAGLQQIA